MIEILISITLKLLFNLFPWYFRDNEVLNTMVTKRSIKEKGKINNLEVLASQIIETFFYVFLAKICHAVINTILNKIHSDNFAQTTIEKKYKILYSTFERRKNLFWKGSELNQKIFRAFLNLRVFLIFNKLHKQIIYKKIKTNEIIKLKSSPIVIRIREEKKSSLKLNKHKITKSTINTMNTPFRNLKFQGKSGQIVNISSFSKSSLENLNSNKKKNNYISKLTTHLDRVAENESKRLTKISSSQVFRIRLKGNIGILLFFTSLWLTMLIVVNIYEKFKDKLTAIFVIPIISSTVITFLVTEPVMILVFTVITWLIGEKLHHDKKSLVSKVLKAGINPIIVNIQRYLFILRDITRLINE